MRCHSVTTYFDGSHEPTFYILAEDDHALLHALSVIRVSKEIDYYEVDGGDGPKFYDELFYKIYPGFRTSTQTTREARE
jgi:hypothetical protein